MFGRHPRLAVDAFLGLENEGHKTHKEYADKLKDRLKYAYKKATEEAKKKGIKYKHYYDQKSRRDATLKEGDRVLVKKIGFQGKHKLADIWEPCTYVVRSQPMPDIPVFNVQKEGSNSKPRLLHRNMLLPFYGIPVPKDSDTEDDMNKQPEVLDEEEESTDSSSSEGDSDRSLPAAREVVAARRMQLRRGRHAQHSDKPHSREPITQRGAQRAERPQRKRRPPVWMQSSDW